MAKNQLLILTKQLLCTKACYAFFVSMAQLGFRVVEQPWYRDPRRETSRSDLSAVQ